MTARTGNVHQIALGRNDGDPKAIPPVTNTLFYKRMEFNFPDRIEFDTDESAVDTNFKDQDTEIRDEFSEPTFGGLLRSRTIGFPLLSICNAEPVTTADANVSAVKSHVFTPSDDEVGAGGLGIIGYNPNYTDPYVAYTNFKASELSFEIDKSSKAWVMFNCSGSANPAIDATSVFSSRAYPTEQLFRFTDAEFRIADDVAGLSAASSVIKCRKLMPKFTRDVERDDIITSTAPDEQYSTQYGYMIDIVQPFRDSNFLDIWKGNREQVARLVLKNENVNIGDQANIIRPELRMDFNRIQIPTYEHDSDISNTVMAETFSFRGLYIPTPFQFTLVNRQDSY